MIPFQTFEIHLECRDIPKITILTLKSSKRTRVDHIQKPNTNTIGINSLALLELSKKVFLLFLEYMK